MKANVLGSSVAVCVHFGFCLRLLEERKEMMEKFAAEQDALLCETQEKHARELQGLRDRYQQQLLTVRAELETRHQAELGELTTSLESERRGLLEALGAELQAKHAADISALETRHVSSLDLLESRYLSEAQAVRAEHRRALERLQADLEEQLQDQATLTQELEKLRLRHDEELQLAKDSLRDELSAAHAEDLRALAVRLQAAHQVRCFSQDLSLLLCMPPVCCRCFCVSVRVSNCCRQPWLDCAVRDASSECDGLISHIP